MAGGLVWWVLEHKNHFLLLDVGLSFGLEDAGILSGRWHFLISPFMYLTWSRNNISSMDQSYWASPVPLGLG